jgi:cytoskeletal protein RodZ
MFESNKQDAAPQKSTSVYLKISIIVFIAVVIYLGFIFWSRSQQSRAFEARQAQEKAQQAAADKKAVDGLGGSEFKILRFYADPSVIARGDATELCYGVSNATSVTLQPQSNSVWPSLNKCVSVSPRKTTAYTLTATDQTGQTKESNLTVEVR